MALIQTQPSSVSATSSQTATWGSNTTSGNLILVGVYTAFGAFSTVSSITDSQSNTYTRIDGVTSGVGNADIEIWYAKNITGGTTPTITVNVTSSSQNVGFIMREYSGLDTSAPLDVSTHAASTNSTPTSSGSTATTATANELVVGWLGLSVSATSVTISAGSGYSNLVSLTDAGGQLALEDMTVSSTGTQTSTFGLSPAVGSWVNGVITFKATSGAPTTLTPSVSDSISISESTNPSLTLNAHVEPGYQSTNGPMIV